MWNNINTPFATKSNVDKNERICENFWRQLRPQQLLLYINLGICWATFCDSVTTRIIATSRNSATPCDFVIFCLVLAHLSGKLKLKAEDASLVVCLNRFSKLVQIQSIGICPGRKKIMSYFWWITICWMGEVVICL